MHKKISRSTLYQLIEAGHMARQLLLNPLHEYQLQAGDDAILLALKKKNPTSSNQLSILTGLPPSPLQQRLERLQTLSLIEYTSPVDGKDEEVHLTKTGRAVRKQLITHWAELEDALMHTLSKKQKKYLHKNLRDFADILSL